MKNMYFKGNVFICIWAQGLVSCMPWVLGNLWRTELTEWIYILKRNFIRLAYMSHTELLHNGLSVEEAAQSKWLGTSAVQVWCWEVWNIPRKPLVFISCWEADGAGFWWQQRMAVAVTTIGWIHSPAKVKTVGWKATHSFSLEPPCSWAPTRKCLPSWGRVFRG